MTEDEIRSYLFDLHEKIVRGGDIDEIEKEIREKTRSSKRNQTK